MVVTAWSKGLLFEHLLLDITTSPAPQVKIERGCIIPKGDNVERFLAVRPEIHQNEPQTILKKN